jgi:hypothetical protein
VFTRTTYLVNYINETLSSITLEIPGHIILDGECTRVEAFERPSADVISIEKIASQKSASNVWMSIYSCEARR